MIDDRIVKGRVTTEVATDERVATDIHCVGKGSKRWLYYPGVTRFSWLGRWERSTA